MTQYGFIDLSILRPDLADAIESHRSKSSTPNTNDKPSININDYLGVRSSIRIFKHNVSKVHQDPEHLMPQLTTRGTGHRKLSVSRNR